MRTFIQRIETLSWLFGPASLTLLLVFGSHFPKHLNLFSDYVPLFAVISIYYWVLFKPPLMPFWFLFGLGLLQDALSSTPLGTSSLVFMLFRIIVLSQRRIFSRERFWAVWFGFMLLSLLAFFGYWTILSIAAKQMVPVVAGVVQWLATVAFYPLIHILFNKVYAGIPADIA